MYASGLEGRRVARFSDQRGRARWRKPASAPGETPGPGAPKSGRAFVPLEAPVALYHLHIKNISRSDGRSAVAVAAYRAGETLPNEAEEKDSAFGGKRDVYMTEIRCPAGAPAWMADRAKLWNAVEKAEVRKDARLAKEIEFALPVELPPAMWIEVARQMADICVARGHVVDLAIHEDGRGMNPHVHLLLATRSVGPDGFGPKLRDADALKFVNEMRKAWTDIANTALGKAGSDAQIDDRSNKARGIDRAPTTHRGPDPAARRARRWGRTKTMDHDTLEARRELLADRQTKERFPLLATRPDWPPERREPVPGLSIPERGEWQRFWREIDERRWGPEVTPSDRRAPDFDDDRVKVGPDQVRPEPPPQLPPHRELYYASVEDAMPEWRLLHAALIERMRAEGHNTDHPLLEWERIEKSLRAVDGHLSRLHAQELDRGMEHHIEYAEPDPDGRMISPMEREQAEERMILEERKPVRQVPRTSDPRRAPAEERSEARSAVDRQNALPVRDEDADAYRLAPHESRLDWLDEPERHEGPVEQREVSRLDWLDDGPRTDLAREQEPERERER